MPCFLYTREEAARFHATTWRNATSPSGICPHPARHSAWQALGETPSLVEVEAMPGIPFSFPCQQCWKQQESLIFFGGNEPTMMLCRDCLLEGLALFPS